MIREDACSQSGGSSSEIDECTRPKAKSKSLCTVMLYLKPKVTVEHRTFSNHLISNAHAIGWILCLPDTMAIIFLTD